MHYVLLYEVGDDYVERRAQFREIHLKNAQAAYDRGELVMAGVMTEPLDGAMLIFRTAEAAEGFAKVDPYVTNGLVAKWRVRKWHTVIGDGATVP